MRLAPWIGLLAVLGTGCLPGPGDCDRSAASELAYDEDGVPAFVGQALVIEGCGGGGFCHTPGIAPADRFGAPAGLDYDLRPVATSGDPPHHEEALALREAQERTLSQYAMILDEVEGGAMPPGGAAGALYESSVTVHYSRASGEPLPSLSTEDGRAALRNWLACGAPVVERTVAPDDAEPNPAGFTVAPCDRTCVDLTWPALYGAVIEPSCATALCHAGGLPAGKLDLSGGPSATYARILDAPARGLLCQAPDVTILTASDPTRSLLYLKVAIDGPTCGVRMPVSGNGLSAQRVCALEAWIRCGACPDDDGGACASCLEAAREGCRVPSGGSPDGACLGELTCAPRL